MRIELKFILKFLNQKQNVVHFAGCSISDISNNIYQSAESKNKSFCTLLMQLVVLMDISIFIPLIIIFLSNVLFDFPASEYYRSPLTAK